MSAQASGRQSPPPELQSGIQQQDPPASGKIGSTTASRPAPEFAQQESDAQKESMLKSNPEHPLEKIEAAKFAKGTGN